MRKYLGLVGFLFVANAWAAPFSSMQLKVNYPNTSDTFRVEVKEKEILLKSAVAGRPGVDRKLSKEQLKVIERQLAQINLLNRSPACADAEAVRLTVEDAKGTRDLHACKSDKGKNISALGKLLRLVSQQ